MKRSDFAAPRRALGLILLSWAALVASQRSGWTAETTTCQPAPAGCVTLPRAQDEIWLVSDRWLGCAEVDARASNLRYWRYQSGQGWQAADSALPFAADDPATITHVWIHGNRIEPSDAFQVGWTAYSAIARQATDARPLRFIAWSWPSERIDGRNREDVRVKASRTGPSALHLARFLDTLPADLPVTISGYSFGARIATGALHAMNGGALNGRRLAMQTAAQRPRMDVVLIAAGLDSDWILPGHCYGNALGMMNRLLLVTNSCDRVLARYHLLYGLRSCTTALGATGLVGGNLLGADRAKVTQFDACCYVGPEHDWSHYFCSPTVVGLMVPYVFQSQPAATTRAPTAATNASTPVSAWE